MLRNELDAGGRCLLEEERRIFEEQQKTFAKERDLFTKNALQLGLERKKLQVNYFILSLNLEEGLIVLCIGTEKPNRTDDSSNSAIFYFG